MSDYSISQIYPTDHRGMEQVLGLLRQEGIQKDGNLDYTCAMYDEDCQIIATGSCFGNTLRCFAVDHRHQGEGLLNEIITHLLEVEYSRGRLHLFVYTKISTAKFFRDIGFYEIARVSDQLVFMENRKTGFPEYLDRLSKYRRPGRSAALVMNANPFTLGHRHLVERAAAENDTVHLFVLSEEAGPIPFAVRKKLVEAGVEDLKNVILHDSGPYIISSATFPSYFLKDGDTVIRTQAELDLRVFGQIAQTLGIQRRYVGREKTSHVTGLYNEIMLARLPEMGIECIEIPRLEAGEKVISASVVRQAIHDNCLEKVRDFLPDSTYAYFFGPESETVRAAIRAEENVIHY